MSEKSSKWDRETSLTAQAMEHNSIRTVDEATQVHIKAIKDNVEKVESALSILITLPPSDDVTDAIRSMGAYHALLARDLFKAQHKA